MKHMLASSLLAACAAPPPPLSLTLSPNGYRAEGDQCRLTFETASTVEYFDDSADLSACPADMENLGIVAIDTGRVEVARISGYVLYCVLRGT
jgi:hypothetical protein